MARSKHFLLTITLFLAWLLLIGPAMVAGDTPAPNDLVNCTPLIVVSSRNDDGDGSLRQAINDVCDGGSIGFDLTPGSYITLMTGELLIEKSLRMLGTGSTTLSLRSVGNSRLIRITNSVTVEISDLSLLNGLAMDGTGAALEGGGILNEGTLTLTNVTFVGNNVPAPGRGGGIANMGGTVTIVGSIFAGNHADGANGIGDGGAIYNDQNGTMSIADTTFWANTAYAHGGGIDNRGALTITNSSLSENNSFTGGAIANRGGELYLYHSVIFENMATVYGGGVQNSGVLLIDTSTLSGNQAAGGGGVYNDDGSVTISNSTVTLNVATQGSGISSGEMGAITLQNSIIAQNSGEECALPAFVVLSLGHNLVGDASCHLTEATDLTQQDAHLGPLLLNGGSTETHALLSGSPALDAGNCLENSVDQRGQLRPIDIPSLSDSGNGCDIGAYEATNALLSLLVGMEEQPPLLPGQPLTYTLHFQNESSSIVSQAIITNSFSLPLTDLVFTSSGVSVTPVAGATAVWQVANISPGAGGVITVTARISDTLSAGSSLINSALIRGQSNVADFADGWGEASVNVSVSQISFEVEAYQVQEDAGTATITVTLDTINPFAPASVFYETIEGTARAGEDYLSVDGQLSIAAGDNRQTFVVSILDNPQANGDRSLTLRLFATTGAMIIPPESVQLVIVENRYTLLLPMILKP